MIGLVFEWQYMMVERFGENEMKYYSTSDCGCFLGRNRFHSSAVSFPIRETNTRHRSSINEEASIETNGIL